MNAILASGLAALCLATSALAQNIASDILVVSGVPYRLTAVNSSLLLVPDVSFASREPGPVLSQDEMLARCDHFVALALKARGFAGKLVRDRVEPGRADRSAVVYAQRHQGYRILGPGGRLELDSYGRIVFAGLNYETEKLRAFRAMNSVALEILAALAVPHPRVGGPFNQEIVIDPLGDAPAQLRAFVTYQVRTKHRVEGWQVILNAETGKVIDTSSMVMNAASPLAAGP